MRVTTLYSMRFALLGFVLALPCLGQGPAVQLTRVATGISSPTDIQNAGDGSGRLFLAQQNGVVRILKGGQVLAAPFLDIRQKTAAGGERGLLGIAFPPGFAQKRYFYVSYTDLNGNSVLARYRVSSGSADTADAASEQVLFTQQQPFANHNGGQIQFGPDGYLYYGLGDGGSANDPQGNGQNRRTFLGKLLRIDVESNLSQYTAPASNPFVGDPLALPEIWAYGLRNPWRFSFDRANGNLWIADVGQGRAEEIDLQPAGSTGGENYGWSVMEGLQCLRGPGCNMAPYTPPILEYTHDGGNCSVTGGYVYRGKKSPGLRGTYLYGDYCSGLMWGLTREGDRWVSRQLAQTNENITTFGQDEDGEVYVGAQGSDAVSLITGPTAPQFTAAAVVNAASFAPGSVAGSAASVFAAGSVDATGIVAAQATPLPLSISDVEVTLNGMSAPLYGVANMGGLEQVNFQVPWELAGAADADVVITRSGVSSAAVKVPLRSAQPGIFTLDGRTALAVHNADNILVSAERPATAGEFVYFYATGLGAVSPQVATGAAAAVSPLSHTVELAQVTIHGLACEVQFSGLAPGLVGVYQINILVPGGLASGEGDLVVSMAGVQSPAVKVRLR